jgi:ferric-dicitrate binding protein FerR (iron transport regulator)
MPMMLSGRHHRGGCLTIPIDETTKEYEQWNQHAQHTKLRFYVDSAQRKAHKGDDCFYMQVEDGCVELRDSKKRAIKEVRKKERMKLKPGMSIKFHDAGELRVLRNVNAHA